MQQSDSGGFRELKKSFEKMVFFDLLMGIQDRHESNWGLLIRRATNQIVSLAPIYDNAAGLGSEMQNDEMLKYLHGKKSFEAYFERWTYRMGFNRKGLRPPDVFRLMRGEWQEAAEEFKKRMVRGITARNVTSCLERVPDEIMSEVQRRFVSCFLRRRSQIILAEVGDGGC